MNKIFLFIIVTAFLLAGGIARAEDRKLRIVTSLSTYADIAKSVGGDLVDVSYIASPRFNPHFIEPRPSDVLKVKRADLFIHSGLDLEVWRGPLLDAAGRVELRQGGERQLDLALNVSLLEIPTRALTRAEGDVHIYGNPHYWLDPQNGKIIAADITRRLKELDSSRASHYQRNLDEFLSRLDKKIGEWRRLLAPFKGSELIGYHNEWVYLMSFAGFKMVHFLEPKPGIPPTPKQIDFLTSYIKQHGIRGIVQATFYPKEASETIASRTGTKVLLLIQNVGELPEASNYIEMQDYNISQLVRAMTDD